MQPRGRLAIDAEPGERQCFRGDLARAFVVAAHRVRPRLDHRDRERVGAAGARLAERLEHLLEPPRLPAGLGNLLPDPSRVAAAGERPGVRPARRGGVAGKSEAVARALAEQCGAPVDPRRPQRGAGDLVEP